jgi:hypothetical protein
MLHQEFAKLRSRVVRCARCGVLCCHVVCRCCWHL